MIKDLAFFGAFNPPTLAHLGLADFARRETGAERVLFIPSKSDYIVGSQGKDRAWGNEERLSMLRRAARTRPWMAVIDREIRALAQPKSYTTLTALREAGYDPRMLVGSDKLGELETWYRAGDLFDEFGVVCMMRGTDDCEGMIAASPFLTLHRDRIKILLTPEDTRGISSSAVRALAAKGDREGLKAMVPEEILDMLFEKEEG